MTDNLYFTQCCRTWQPATDLCCARKWIKGEDVGNHTVQSEDRDTVENSEYRVYSTQYYIPGTL